MATEQKRTWEACGATWDICVWCLGIKHRSGLSDEWVHNRWWDAFRCAWGQLTSGRVHGG